MNTKNSCSLDSDSSDIILVLNVLEKVNNVLKDGEKVDIVYTTALLDMLILRLKGIVFLKKMCLKSMHGSKNRIVVEKSLTERI